MQIKRFNDKNWILENVDSSKNIKTAPPTQKKITRRTTGARGCYFQTSVYQVIKSKFQSRYNFNMLQVMRKYHILCLLTSVRKHVSIYRFCLQVSSTKYQVKSPRYRVAKWGRKDIYYKPNFFAVLRNFSMRT